MAAFNNKTSVFIHHLLKKPELTLREQNLLTNYLLRHCKNTESIEPAVPNETFVYNYLSSFDLVVQFLIVIQKIYYTTCQNYQVFRQTLIKSNPDYYKLFHILIGNSPKDGIITYDYFDNMIVALLQGWRKSLNLDPIPTNKLLGIADSLRFRLRRNINRSS